MPLVTRLANETSPKARTATAATLKLLHQQLQQDSNDSLAALAQQWLVRSSSGSSGSNGGGQQQQKLRAVAAQALELLAEVEGGRFGSRRLGADFVQGLAARLAAAAAAAEDVLVSQGVEGEGDLPGSSNAAGGGLQWQEPYHVLLLLEKAAQGGLGPLLWQQGPAVQQLWGEVVQEMLLYPHLWVRKAAARLLGLGLANPGVYSGLLGLSSTDKTLAADAAAAANGAAENGAYGGGDSSSGGVGAGRCALLVYLQLEADVVDEGLCTQAVKCLVALTKHLAAAQPQQQQQQDAVGGASAAAAAGTVAVNGAAGDSSSEEEEDDEDADMDADGEAAAAEQGAAAGGDEADGGFKDGQLTLLGLISRMVRLAEDTRFVRQQQRMAALRWIAAAVSATGTAPLLPHLPLLLRPLYRIAEASGEQKIHAQAVKGSGAAAAAAAAATPDDVVVLSDQVMAHLRTQFGAETLLSAYATAREDVRASRAARKTAAARKALLDPEAAARLKLKRGRKKSEARQRKAEDRRRARSARGSGGFGYKAAKGAKRSGKSHKLAQKSAQWS